MIVLFHAVMSTISSVINRYRQYVTYTSENVVYTGISKYCVDGLEFDPPMYIQRQEAVYKVLNDFCLQKDIKKIVDFGCGSLQYFKIFKNLDGIQELLEIDVDADLLEKQHTVLMPTVGDFLGKRKCQLNVKVLAGSISNLDSRLLGTDAVVCVEVIEHLYPETLENVPWAVFGFIKPQIAIFTTPNRDINILFELKTPFRDDDHKFEWSRQQFRCWGFNIIKRYPDYTVNFYGIGKGPPGAESLGCCSQMAVFIRVNDSLSENITNQEDGLVYKFIAEYTYPAHGNYEQGDECVVNEVDVILKGMGLSADNQNPDFKIPLSLLHSKLRLNTPSITELQRILEKYKWKMEYYSGELHVLPFFEESDMDSQSVLESLASDDFIDDAGDMVENTQCNVSNWDHCEQYYEEWDTQH